LGVKYAFGVWNGCGQERIYFISQSAKLIFHFCRKAYISLFFMAYDKKYRLKKRFISFSVGILILSFGTD